MRRYAPLGDGLSRPRRTAPTPAQPPLTSAGATADARAADTAPVAALYRKLEHDTRARLDRYSAEELAVIARFLREMYDVGVDHVARLD